MDRRNRTYITSIAAGILMLRSTVPTTAKTTNSASVIPVDPYLTPAAVTQKFAPPTHQRRSAHTKPSIIRKDIGFVSGQLPIRDGKLVYTS